MSAVRVAPGIYRQGSTLFAAWMVNGERFEKRGFRTLEAAIAYHQQHAVRGLELKQALDRALETPGGYRWAFGRAETGERLVACREPDGQVSVSVEIGEEDEVTELRPVDALSPLLQGAYWRPEVGP